MYSDLYRSLTQPPTSYLRSLLHRSQQKETERGIFREQSCSEVLLASLSAYISSWSTQGPQSPKKMSWLGWIQDLETVKRNLCCKLEGNEWKLSQGEVTMSYQYETTKYNTRQYWLYRSWNISAVVEGARDTSSSVRHLMGVTNAPEEWLLTWKRCRIALRQAMKDFSCLAWQNSG